MVNSDSLWKIPGWSGIPTLRRYIMTIEHQTPRVWRRRQVELECGLKKSTIFDQAKKGVFPPPIKIGPRASGWLSFEVICVIGMRAAGKSETEIRAAVEEMVIARSAA
jgi:prophage regulatory protein